MKTKMVVGFMFNEKETDVLLIQKNRPNWQRGKFNGIGGHVKEGESTVNAMCREFKEETGIEQNSWYYIATIGDEDDWEVEIFCCKNDAMFHPKMLTDEEPYIITLSELDDYDCIENLYWIIPMCLDKMKGGLNYSISNNQYT